MAWDQVEPTPPHVTYLLLSTFLISYVLFTNFLRNKLHLSEPPIALLTGVILGPYGLGWITPNFCSDKGCGAGIKLGSGEPGQDGWGWGDNVIQEVTRIIVGVQVFAVGVELPKFYMGKHWRDVAMMLGPVMAFGWVICAIFCHLIFGVDIPTAMVISACLTPTDPVLASSILSNSQFAESVPKRLRDMLSAESGCNDGISFPFLYLGLYFLTQPTHGMAIKDWFLITILWQCVFGTFIGLVIGTTFNKILRFSNERKYIDDAGFVVFYLLLAIFCVGVGSTLGSDDFLVAFGAGYGFARDGWFSEKIREAHLPKTIDLLWNSSMFVYLGTIMPWEQFRPQQGVDWITPGRLVAFLVLVLTFRRLPIMLVIYRWAPSIETIREAVFCGHFGPMGLGALFLAIEARAVLENGNSIPDAHPGIPGVPRTARDRAIITVWPVISFVVFGSTIVHGLSVLAMSLFTYLTESRSVRGPFLSPETDPVESIEPERYRDDPEDVEAANGH